jgi:hypothetical protein
MSPETTTGATVAVATPAVVGGSEGRLRAGARCRRGG